MICRECLKPWRNSSGAIGTGYHHSCLGGCECFCNFVCDICEEKLKDTVSVVDCWYKWFTDESNFFIVCRECNKLLRQKPFGWHNLWKIEYWERNELKSE